MILHAHTARPLVRPRHLGWASRAVVSGFLASLAALLVLLGAYGFAVAAGSTNPDAGPFARPFWNLTHNPVTALVASVHGLQAVGLHLAVGLAWAVVYAAVVAPAVPGPGWKKGLIFAAVPCLISELVVLPALGAGVFGLAVGAGPLAGLGALLLHAIYGITLGEAYALADGEGVTGGVDSPRARLLTRVERDVAAGLIMGAVLGAVVSLLLELGGIMPVSASNAGLTILGGATEGGIAGVVTGTLLGIIAAGDDA